MHRKAVADMIHELADGAQFITTTFRLVADMIHELAYIAQFITTTFK